MEAQLLLDYLSTNRFFFKLNQKKNTNQIRWMLIEVNLKLELPPLPFYFTKNFLAMEAQLLVDY